MLGYVNIIKSALSEEEYDIYNGYYCGVCKSIGARHGQFPRLALSYDIVFLALILSSLNSEEDIIEREHCIIHPIERKPTIKNDAAVDYAADMLLILAYYNFLDDKNDEHKLRGTLGSGMLSGSYAKLRKTYPDIVKAVEDNLSKLSELERAKSGSLDMTCAAFGDVLGAVFSGWELYQKGDGISGDETSPRYRILEGLGRSLGKWIYLMDALDDLEKDKKSGSYNPLIYRDRGAEGLNDLLYNYLGDVSSAIDLLEIRKNKGIIDNIVWNGLRARTEVMLNGDEVPGEDEGVNFVIEGKQHGPV